MVGGRPIPSNEQLRKLLIATARGTNDTYTRACVQNANVATRGARAWQGVSESRWSQSRLVDAGWRRLRRHTETLGVHVREVWRIIMGFYRDADGNSGRGTERCNTERWLGIPSDAVLSAPPAASAAERVSSGTRSPCLTCIVGQPAGLQTMPRADIATRLVTESQNQWLFSRRIASYNKMVPVITQAGGGAGGCEWAEWEMSQTGRKRDRHGVSVGDKAPSPGMDHQSFSWGTIT